MSKNMWEKDIDDRRRMEKVLSDKAKNCPPGKVYNTLTDKYEDESGD